MAAGLVVMDLLWALGLVGVAWGATSVALAVHDGLDVAPALQLVGAALAFVVAWLAICSLVLLLLPKPRPGRYRVMRGRDFYLWVFGFIARRWLELPPFGLLMRQSAILRFLVLRASGAKIAFTAQVSADATILDPSLLVMGPSAMLGSQSTVAGHFILGDQLILAPVVIGPGAQVALDVVLGPGVTVGERAVIEARSSVGPQCRIGAGAIVGGGAALGRGVTVSDGATIPMCAILPAGTFVPPLSDADAPPLPEKAR